MVTIRVKRTVKTYGLKSLYYTRRKYYEPKTAFVRLLIEGGKPDELVITTIDLDLEEAKVLQAFLNENLKQANPFFIAEQEFIPE